MRRMFRIVSSASSVAQKQPTIYSIVSIAGTFCIFSVRAIMCTPTLLTKSCLAAPTHERALLLATAFQAHHAVKNDTDSAFLASVSFSSLLTLAARHGPCLHDECDRDSDPP